MVGFGERGGRLLKWLRGVVVIRGGCGGWGGGVGSGVGGGGVGEMS